MMLKRALALACGLALCSAPAAAAPKLPISHQDAG